MRAMMTLARLFLWCACILPIAWQCIARGSFIAAAAAVVLLGAITHAATALPEDHNGG